MTLRILLVILGAAGAIPAQVAQTGANPAQPQQKGRVEGRVVNSATGEPLRKATLRLRTTAVTVGSTVVATGVPTTMATIVATTDAEGKFAFEDVEPASYTLMAERSGFVNQNYNETGTRNGFSPVVVSAGQEKKGILVKMIPQAVISGRITDEDGDPMPGVNVQVVRNMFNGRGRQMMMAGGAQSNPDGTFMIGNLAAGKYYLSATSNRNMFSDGAERAANRTRENYVPTYFPNAIEISAATPLEVTAGQELRGIDIRMRKQPVFSIRGKVISDTSVQNTMLMVVPKDQESMFMMRRQSVIRDKEGSFGFVDLPAGTYIIQSMPNGNRNNESGPALMARMEVTISDRNIDELQVQMLPLVEIKGTIKIEGVEWKTGNAQADQRKANETGVQSSTPSPRPNINLLPMGGIVFNSSNARAGDDGSFVLKNVGGSKYRIQVNGLPDGTYVKSMRFGSQDVTNGEIDMSTPAGGTLDIVLSPKAGDLSGVVRDANGTAVQRIQLSIWVPGSGDQPKTSMTDQNGNFKVRNLAPGDYKVIAWQDVEPGLPFDPDFLKRFESQAVSVSVKESSHESADVKIMPKDVIDAEAAKVK